MISALSSTKSLKEDEQLEWAQWDGEPKNQSFIFFGRAGALL